AGLSQTCRQCPVVSSCGGGLYAHRYRSGTGFANPAVYCADLLKLITHIGEHPPKESAQVPAAPTPDRSRAYVRALAAGLRGARAIAQLTGAQRTVRRALLSAVYEEGTAASAVPDPVRAGLETAWAALTTIDRKQPEALDAVLGHPYVRVWA